MFHRKTMKTHTHLVHIYSWSRLSYIITLVSSFWFRTWFYILALALDPMKILHLDRDLNSDELSSFENMRSSTINLNHKMFVNDCKLPIVRLFSKSTATFCHKSFRIWQTKQEREIMELIFCSFARFLFPFLQVMFLRKKKSQVKNKRGEANIMGRRP